MIATKEKTVKAVEVSRRYYEVWGDALADVQFLKKVCMVLLFVVVILLVMLSRALRRPPVVIRVDAIGKAEPVRDYQVNNQVSAPEIKEFVRLFMRNILERNYLTFDKNLAEADKMISERLRADLNSRIDWKAETDAIEHNRLTSTLELSNIEVIRDLKDSLVVKVKGYRRIVSTDESKPYSKETVFESELGILKVARSMTLPYGLLVDSYKQDDFKSQ